MTNEEQITNGSRMDHRTVANCELSKQMTIERWQLCGISSYLLASTIRKQLRNVQLLELPFDSNDPRSFFLQTPRSSAEDHLLLPCIINQSKSQSRHLTLCFADEIDLNGRGDPKKVLRPTWEFGSIDYVTALSLIMPLFASGCQTVVALAGPNFECSCQNGNGTGWVYIRNDTTSRDGHGHH